MCASLLGLVLLWERERNTVQHSAFGKEQGNWGSALEPDLPAAQSFALTLVSFATFSGSRWCFDMPWAEGLPPSSVMEYRQLQLLPR